MADPFSLEDRKRRACQEIPDVHKAEPVSGEVFACKEEAMQRLQDYAFCKGFAIVTTKQRRKIER